MSSTNRHSDRSALRPRPEDHQLIVAGNRELVRASGTSRPDGGASPRRVRWAGYWSIVWLIAMVTASVAVGRILDCRAEINRTEMPFFSANDRSRWCTVRALVDHGTYEIDAVLESEDGRNWDTIDKVRHIGRDGAFHYYSSKPTLLPTVMAGGYWLVREATGKTITDNPFFVIRTLLILFHGSGFMLAVLAMGWLARSLSSDPSACIFAVVTGALGTFALTYANTFNNHLPAALSVLLSLCCVVPVWRNRLGAGPGRVVRAFLLMLGAGLFSAFAAACDLPALSFTAVCLGLCMLRSPALTSCAFVPAALLVAVASFGTNYLAHDTWKPPYAHRDDGKVLGVLSGDFEQEFERGVVPLAVASQIRAAGVEIGVAPTVVEGAWPTQSSQRWLINFGKASQTVLAKNRDRGTYEIQEWNNWYEFPGSYWLNTNTRKSVVDRGTPDPVEYLFHITVGHHGVISQTPIWLAAIFGVMLMFGRRRLRMRLVAVGISLITVVVFAFYVSREPHDRNYGGWTCCFRWAIWIYPLWWIAVVVAADRFWRYGWLKLIFSLLLAASIAQAVIPAENPWNRPWLQDWFEQVDTRR